MPVTLDESTRRVATRLGHLHVRIVGDGPTAVLMPSMFVDTHTFDPLIPHLAAARRLVLIEGPGLGESDPLTRLSSVGEAAEAARDALGELGIGEPVDVVGNGLGGHLGYKLAREAGLLRSLVAVGAPPEPNPPDTIRMVRQSLAVVATLGRGPLVKPVGAKLLAPASVRNPEIWKVFRAGFLTPTRQSMANATRSFVLTRADVRDELGGIRVPTLYVVGDQSGEWGPQAAERAAAMTPVAKVAVVSGAGTLVPLEQPEALARVILDHWDAPGREQPA